MRHLLSWLVLWVLFWVFLSTLCRREQLSVLNLEYRLSTRGLRVCAESSCLTTVTLLTSCLWGKDVLCVHVSPFSIDRGFCGALCAQACGEDNSYMWWCLRKASLGNGVGNCRPIRGSFFCLLGFVCGEDVSMAWSRILDTVTWFVLLCNIKR